MEVIIVLVVDSAVPGGDVYEMLELSEEGSVALVVAVMLELVQTYSVEVQSGRGTE